MSHYEEYYEEYYNDLVKQKILTINKKKEEFINNKMKDLEVSYQEAELIYEKDMQNHNKILNSWYKVN